LAAVSSLAIIGAAVAVGSVPAGATTPPPGARLIVTTGHPIGSVAVSSTSFTAALTPAFNPNIHNYVLNCPATTSAVTFTMSVPAGTITYKGQTGTSVAATMNLSTDQAAVIRGTSPFSNSPDDYWIRCLPTDFPQLKVVTDTGQAPNGYYVTENAINASPGVGPYVMVLDRHGTPIWWQKTFNVLGNPAGAAWFDLWAHNQLAWDSAASAGQPNFNDAAGFTLYDLASNTSSGLLPNNASADGHDIVHLSDGNIIFLTNPEVTGVDLSSIGLGTNQNVADCGLQEVTPTGQVVWSWSALPHVGVDESTAPIKDTINGQTVYDLFHCNSVSLAGGGATNPETANIILSFRENSAIYQIDRSTGNVVWKVGGTTPSASDPDASAQHITVANDPEGGFFAEHDANLSASGELTLFDDHSPNSAPGEMAGAARGVEYKVDTTAGTATLDWSYAAPDNEASLATGSFVRYAAPGGGSDNVVGWGFNPGSTVNGVTTTKLFSEVNGNGKVTLAMDFVANGGVEDCYRVHKVATSDLDINVLHQSMGGLP
jgi:hypothetical protein